MTMGPGRAGSSNSGAIVYAVVATIVAVICMVLAIMFYVRANSSQIAEQGLEQDYAKVINRSNLSGTTVSELEGYKQDTATFSANQPLIEVATTASRKQAQAITGDPQATYRSALDQLSATIAGAAAAVDEAAEGDGPTIATSGSAVGTIDALKQELIAAIDQQRQMRGEMQSLQQELDAVIARADEARSTSTASVEQATQERLDALKLLTERDESLQGFSDVFTTQFEDLENRYNDGMEQLQASNRALESRVAELQTIVERYEEMISAQRPDVATSMTTVADGQIETVADDGNVYINLGQGDGIARGMTFEVFDSTAGIPASSGDADDTTIPLGKASIEIVRVQPGSSEARVVESRGGPVAAGDIITNVVYDKNNKFNFFVFGDFDLDNDGRISPADAEIVKRLVSQWGGTVVSDLDIDTDFVVLGAVPEIPAGLDRNDPLERVILQEAEAKQERYNAIEAQAVERSIPILNQNRFLAFTGYYDLARR